jgi:glycosyltransferase involved in cell wall biosynthesis
VKLLYITEDRYPPYRADVVELFAKEMPRYGHRIDWLMQRGPNTGSEPNETEWFGQRVFLGPRSRLPGLAGRIANAIYGVLGDLRVFAIARTQRYDAIQVRDKFFSSLLALLAARLTGAKFFYWMSYPFPEAKLYLAENGLAPNPLLYRLKGYITGFLLYKVILPRADHIFVQSHQMREDVATHGIAQGKMTPVLMGIRADQVLSGDAAKTLDTTHPKLLYLGTLNKIRRLDMLVRVLPRVLKRYPGAKLYFVGGGETPSDETILRNEVAHQDVDQSVVFTGFLPMEQAWDYVREADICFSPFFPIPILLSTSPTKLIEYLAMAKNVVANEHPEQRLVLEQSGAGRCVPWDEQAFADEICRLLDDPQQARALAARGPDYVRATRSYDVIGSELHRRYLELLRDAN